VYYCHDTGKVFAAEDFAAMDDDSVIARARLMDRRTTTDDEQYVYAIAP